MIKRRDIDIVSAAVRMLCSEAIHAKDAPCAICGPAIEGYDDRPAYLEQRLELATEIYREQRKARIREFVERFKNAPTMDEGAETL